MRIYIHKVFEHDITHEVSVTLEVVEGFFHNAEEFKMIGKKSNVEGVVNINNVTDPRFGGDFKKILVSEGNIEVGDIIVMTKHNDYYIAEIIKSSNPDKEYYDKFLAQERHNEIFIDDESNDYDLRQFYINNLLENNYIENEINNRKKFVSEYPIDKLLTLSKEEYCLGLDTYKNSFCNKLEKGEYSNTGFGIGGANSAKFGFYFKKDNQYHGKNDKLIDDPNEYWKEFRSQLHDFIVYMGTNEPNFSLDEKYPLLGGSGGYMYLTKLLCLYYPNRFISMSKPSAYSKLGKYLGKHFDKESISNSYYANIEFRKYVPEANEHDGFYIANAIWKYFDMDNEKSQDEKDDEGIIMDESKRLKHAFNKIYYGIPGCGKSYLANEFAKKQTSDESFIVRTTFYPDYTNSDFVGQIIPKIDNQNQNNVLYDIQSGPFTEAMVKAIDNPEQYVFLIVEEINRGSAAAIFGDVFQLLDRNPDGTSEYWIKNYTISEYLKIHCKNSQYNFDQIKIPSNLYLIGTMNTSDQNVFTLDTAFKRRWEMEYIRNDVNASKYKDKKVPMLDMTWAEFVDTINEEITSNDDSLGINGEDKQIGAYFISELEWNQIEELNKTDKKEEAARIFAEKVLSYLWEDVTKLDKTIIFKENYTTFDKVINDFTNSKEVLNISNKEE